MKFRRFALAALPAALLFAACGDEPISTIDEARTSTPVTGDAARFGPAPRLGGNVLTVSPGHAASLRQGATRSPDPKRPQGVCATVSFQGLNGNAQWFRMAIDGKEVTEELVWIVAGTDNPTGGTVCYAPPEGLAIADHAAAVSVQDPQNPAAATRQLVAWKFSVTE